MSGATPRGGRKVPGPGIKKRGYVKDGLEALKCRKPDEEEAGWMQAASIYAGRTGTEGWRNGREDDVGVFFMPGSGETVY